MLWLYGVKYWLPYGIVAGVISGVHTTVHVIRSEDAKWLRWSRGGTAVASVLVFMVGYAAWLLWLICELPDLWRNRGKIRDWVGRVWNNLKDPDKVNLAIVILFLLGRAFLAIPGAVIDRFKRQPTSTSTTSPS